MEPWISQTGQRRFTVVCRFVTGEACTLLFVGDGSGWLLYRLGVEEPGIQLSEDGARAIVEGLGAA